METALGPQPEWTFFYIGGSMNLRFVNLKTPTSIACARCKKMFPPAELRPASIGVARPPQ
jgi:hypothetical protein